MKLYLVEISADTLGRIHKVGIFDDHRKAKAAEKAAMAEVEKRMPEASVTTWITPEKINQAEPVWPA